MPRSAPSPFAFAEPPPSNGRLLRFAAISIPLYAAVMPLAAYLPAIYARDLGVPLATIGVLFLIGQALNIVLDPIAGALSDRTVSRFGRRRPWIAVGGPLFIAGAALLFFPPGSVTPGYLLAALLLLYLGWTAIQTPFLAWSGEIATDYHQRTRVASWLTLVSAIAIFVSLVLPTIADQIRPGDGRLQLKLMGALTLATAIPGLLLTLTALPDQVAQVPPARFSLKATVRAILGNPLLLRVLASDAAVRAGQGIRTALMVFVVGVCLQRPAWAAGLFLFQFVFGMVAGPVWGRIGIALGKHRAAVLAELAQAGINAALLLATPDRFGLVLALALAQGLTQGSGNLLLRAIVADLADAHRAETGEHHAGLYYSVFSLSEKAGGALAIGVALPLVGWLGFHPHGVNSPAALHGLLAVFALGPALAHATAAALLAGFPLDEHAHSAIRARLEAEAAGFVPAE